MTHRLVTPTPARGGVAVVDALADLLYRLPVRAVCALGVGVPGLARDDGTVWAPNIPGWQRMPLGRILSRRFRLPVLVESDRNGFVAGEAWLGSARNCRDVVFVAIGTGIGAGIVSGGRLIRGHGVYPKCSRIGGEKSPIHELRRTPTHLVAHGFTTSGSGQGGRFHMNNRVACARIISPDHCPSRNWINPRPPF